METLEERMRDVMIKDISNLGHSLDSVKSSAKACAQIAGDFAKQKAEAFVLWLEEEGYKAGSQNKAWYKWVGMDCEERPYSLSELYNSFNKQP